MLTWFTAPDLLLWSITTLRLLVWLCFDSVDFHLEKTGSVLAVSIDVQNNTQPK